VVVVGKDSPGLERERLVSDMYLDVTLLPWLRTAAVVIWVLAHLALTLHVGCAGGLLELAARVLVI
jgi:hypothetical protein